MTSARLAAIAVLSITVGIIFASFFISFDNFNGVVRLTGESRGSSLSQKVYTEKEVSADKINKKPFVVYKTKQCTLDILRNITLQNGYFPNRTHWRNHSIHHKTLLSDDCRVPQRDVHPGKCFRRKRIRKIAILGDSNANQMTNHLMRLLAAKNCTKLGEENTGNSSRSSVNATWFFPGMYKVNRTHARGEGEDVVLSHIRDCRGCGGKLYRCWQPGGDDVTIDFEANEFLLDNELSTFRLGTRMCGLPERLGNGPPCPQSYTTQQVLLKEYLPRGGYPDLLLIFSNSHDVKTNTRAETELYAHFLGGMLRLYVPPTTTVLFFSKPYEDMWLKDNRYKMLYEGKGTLEQDRLMNERLAVGMMEAFADRSRNIYPYFDVFKLGQPHSRDWGHDGVHRKPQWYQHFLKYFLRIFCQ